MIYSFCDIIQYCHLCGYVFSIVKKRMLFFAFPREWPNCVAANGAYVFRCVASAAHFFVMGEKYYEE